MLDLEKAGKYEIQSRIGEGGFGVVYKGRDPFIKRTVAIKTCTTENEGTRRRFLREAEIAGNIVHPNITVVYDFGFEGDVPYLVQEFLSGEDLDVKINRRDSIPLRTKLDYLLQTAQGLGFAHEKGITHRDIKPSNLRVLEDGRIKIMDFGIAKLASGETQLTQTGTTLGTPAYLSPEQLRGDEVDARSDIYSFGALAYELLTHRRMFDAQTISALFFQILHQEPTALTQCLDDCPEALADLVAGCVAKDPDDRLQSFVDIIVGLRRVLDQLPAETLAAEPGTDETPATPGPSKEDSRERDRQGAIAEARNEIEELLAAGSPDEAAAALGVARERFGDLVPFRTLHERLVQARAALEVEGVEESAELLAAVEGVRRLTHEGRLNEAVGALEAARSEFPEGPSLIAAGRQLKVQSKISESREALADGQVEVAEQAAQRAQELDPDTPQLAALLASIEQTIEQSTGPPIGPPIETPATPQDPPAQLATPSETPTAEIPIPRLDPDPIPPAPPVELPSTLTKPKVSEDGAASPAGRMRRLPLAAAVVAAALLLMLALFGLRHLLTPTTTGTGQLKLDALPWAEVVSLTNESGDEIGGLSTGGQLFTPLGLDLPPGTYRVTLARPDKELERTFEIAVAAAASSAQRIELEPVDVTEYFRRVGLIVNEGDE